MDDDHEGWENEGFNDSDNVFFEGLSFFDNNNNNVSRNNDSSFDASFESRLFPLDTPEKSVISSTPIKKPDAFQKPVHALVKCHICKSTFKTISGYNSHLNTHSWRDAALKKPSAATLLEYSLQGATEVLEEMKKNPAGGEWGSKFIEYVASLTTCKTSTTWTALVTYVHETIIKKSFPLEVQKKNGKRKIVVLTSAWREILQRILSSALCNGEVRDTLIDLLMQILVVEQPVAWSFLSSFCRQLGNKVLTKVCRFIKDATPALQKPLSWKGSDDFTKIYSQRTLHYISGAIVRGVVRKAKQKQYLNNAKLQRFKEVLLTRISKFGERRLCDPDNVSLWTSTINRGSLVFVHISAFPFFVEVAKLLANMELPDGSFYHERVITEVYKTSSVISIWDNLIGESLSHNESEELLIIVVKALTNTFGRGILLRRNNKTFVKSKGKGQDPFGHRARLAK